MCVKKKSHPHIPYRRFYSGRYYSSYISVWAAIHIIETVQVRSVSFCDLVERDQAEADRGEQ